MIEALWFNCHNRMIRGSRRSLTHVQVLSPLSLSSFTDGLQMYNGGPRWRTGKQLYEKAQVSNPWRAKRSALQHVASGHVTWVRFISSRVQIRKLRLKVRTRLTKQRLLKSCNCRVSFKIRPEPKNGLFLGWLYNVSLFPQKTSKNHSGDQDTGEKIALEFLSKM